jgi:ABC-type uncharacterized transport system permease subunit
MALMLTSRGVLARASSLSNNKAVRTGVTSVSAFGAGLAIGRHSSDPATQKTAMIVAAATGVAMSTIGERFVPDSLRPVSRSLAEGSLAAAAAAFGCQVGARRLAK